MDCSPPGSTVHGDSWGKNTGVSCHALLQGSSQSRNQTQICLIAGRFFAIWATREAKNTGLGRLSLLQGIFPTQELNQGLLYCRRILYQLSYQGSLGPSIEGFFSFFKQRHSRSPRKKGTKENDYANICPFAAVLLFRLRQKMNRCVKLEVFCGLRVLSSNIFSLTASDCSHWPPWHS